MLRWLKYAIWSVLVLVGVLALCVAALIGFDRLQFSRAIRRARSLPPSRLERLVGEAGVIAAQGENRMLEEAMGPLADTGAKYVVVMARRVDLVFYKSMEDEVVLYVYLPEGRIDLAYPVHSGWKVETRWPNNASKPTTLLVTPRPDTGCVLAAATAHL